MLFGRLWHRAANKWEIKSKIPNTFLIGSNILFFANKKLFIPPSSRVTRFIMTFNVIHWNWNTPQPQPHGWWLYTNKLVILPHLKDPNRLQKQHQQKKWLHNIISHHFPRVCNGTRGGHPFGSSSLSGTVVRRDSNLIMLSSFRSSNFICVWTNSENVSGNGIMSETFSSGGCDRRKLEIGNELRFTLGWFVS